MTYLIESDVDDYLRKEFGFDINEEIDEVENFKSRIVPKLLDKAKRLNFSKGTINKYKNGITKCDNRSKKKIKTSTRAFASSLMKRS